MLASAFASTTGLWKGSTMIPLAILIVVVWVAARVSATVVSRNGRVGGIEKPAGCGSGRATCSPVQSDSSPAASAYWATSIAHSGSAQVP
jgi:hypothetical protein